MKTWNTISGKTWQFRQNCQTLKYLCHRDESILTQKHSPAVLKPTDLPPGVSLKTFLWVEKMNLLPPAMIKLVLFSSLPDSQNFNQLLKYEETEKFKVRNW